MLCNIAHTWNLKKPNSQKWGVEWWLPEAGRWEKLVDVGHRVQTSHSNMNKFWGLNA